MTRDMLCTRRQTRTRMLGFLAQAVAQLEQSKKPDVSANHYVAPDTQSCFQQRNALSEKEEPQPVKLQYLLRKQSPAKADYGNAVS